MTIYSGQTTQLLQGVSQQHPKDRAEGQVGAQVNCISDVVSGLRRRPAFKVLSELTGITTNFTLDDNTAVYSYSRGDGSEEYIMMFDTAGRIKIYNAITGAECTVSGTAGVTYLTDTSPASSLRFHTIGDTTFALNTKKVVAMSAGSSSPALGATAIIYCVKASYGHTYQILIDGAVKASCTTVSQVTITAGTQDKSITLSSDDVLYALWNGSTANPLITPVTCLFGTGGTLTGTYTGAIQGDVMRITCTAGTTFAISTSDGNHGVDLHAVRNSVTAFENLPKYAPAGYKMQVKGSGDSKFDDYWVKWEPDDESTTGFVASSGVWQECIAPSTLTALDATTMPITIKRTGVNAFTRAVVAWVPRSVGDDDTNPEPSFVGTTMNDIGSYQNRLYMLTGENICMSRAFDHLAFFSESVAATAPDDPVDSASSDNQITDLLHSAIFNGSLVLFSNNAQFINTKDTPIDPATFAVASDTAFNVSPRVKPVTTGVSIMFPTDFGEYTNIWEYNINTLSGKPECEAVTKHVPRYIVGNPKQVVANTTTDYVFVTTDSDSKDIYVLQFYVKDQKRAQLSWHKWTLDNVDKIISITLLNQRLFAVVERSSKVYLEFSDLALPLTANSNFELYLDHYYSTKVIQTGGPWIINNKSYASRVLTKEPDITTFVQGIGCTNEGFILTGTVVDGDYLYCQQPEDAYVIQGYSFTSSGTVTNPYVKDAQGRPYTKRTIVDEVTFNVQDTGWIQFEVVHKAGTNYTETFNARILNNWQYVIGEASELDADIYLPIRDYRQLVDINFTSNHHLGFSVMSFDWLARMESRGRRSQ